jgi:orotidine-5'-phosphate decarboxylase
MIPEEKIIVAIDTADGTQVTNLFEALKGHKIWIKVGMELYYNFGPDVVRLAKKSGHKVFLDLKLHDIPTTVAQAMKCLCKLPIDMINLHAAGGSEMMIRAAEAVGSSKHQPLLIAVTQLTSTTQYEMNEEQKIPGPLLQSVLNYARLAKDSGCQGIVCSPHEVPEIKKELGTDFLAITPGIRPIGTDIHDQSRVTTPADALRLGADFMVIGRPITQAPNPAAALINIVKSTT